MAIPSGQVLRLIQMLGPFTFAGKEWPAGSWVVVTDSGGRFAIPDEQAKRAIAVLTEGQ